MPVLHYAAASCVPGIYDEKPVGINGIPLKWYVRPVARQGGVFVDHPKGFQLAECLVECCTPPENGDDNGEGGGEGDGSED